MRCPNLQQATITQMREMRAAGMKVKDIARGLGLSEGSVSRYTADVPYARQQTKEAKNGKKPNDEKLRTRWREIQESYQELLLARQEKSMLEKGMRPCEHCRWRRDGAREIVCLRYCDLWGAQWTRNKKAPARSCTSDRRTAPNEAATQLPLS